MTSIEPIGGSERRESVQRILMFLLLFLVSPFPVTAQDEPTPNSPFDFAISRSFLEQLWAQDVSANV